MFRFAIDRGGTFTDVYAECPGGKIRTLKLLSVDPAYPDAPTEAIRRILQEETGVEYPRGSPVDTSKIETIRMGTTVATNALLERKGVRMALLISEGYKDLLHIGNQARPNIFDLEIITPDVLYEEVVLVEERLVLKQEKCKLDLGSHTQKGKTGEEIHIFKSLNKEKLRHDLQQLLKKGIHNIAVVLMHSYIYDGHEQEVGKIAREMGFSHVSLSSEVMPMVRLVSRGYTACADAYLTPCIRDYISGFARGFKGGVNDVRVLFMQSDGGLTPVDSFIGSRAILSGPAGGVVGYALTTYGLEGNKPVIGFDMGGTSTDVSHYDGAYEHVFETTTAGVSIQAPQLDINTVAAGGGSRLFFRAGMFVVGPESAGAHPGPICYRKDGYLAVTDANLVLGRILPDYFPKIFGKTKDQPLDREASLAAFQKLTSEVNAYMAAQPEAEGKHNDLTVEEVAMGFVRVANEAMCRPIRALSQAKGHDTSKHVLACFGGAGGQHACAIAMSLGMSTIFVHKYAGILSAYGLALADVVHEAQEPCACSYEPENFKYIDERIEVLIAECKSELRKQGFSDHQIVTEPFLHMRYDRTDCALMCSTEDKQATKSTSKFGDFHGVFLERYKREFGFTITERRIIIDDIRVRGIGKSGVTLKQKLERAKDQPDVETIRQCYFEGGYYATKVYLTEKLTFGHVMEGPAIIIDKDSTIVVEPNCTATINEGGDVKIEVSPTHRRQIIGTELDAIQLSIFSHRFMSTAEQMGRVLQRTSISTNIKERLDFSCAMFGPDGGLVANAPHIPVHLGAMQETVQYQIKALGDDLNEGDVILSNHPSAGGSHLPDLTVITPVFYKNIAKPVFFVASRGHHADIGGITPGSMPPHSKTIYEEGAVFMSFKLVKNGEFQEKAVTEALMEPAKYPGSSGTRNLHDNLSDLRAQVAANHKGISLIKNLIDEYGLDVVQAYMHHIQANAELAVKEMLQEIGMETKKRTGKSELFATDYMDDGSAIKLKVVIDEVAGKACFDFSGTGDEVYGNCNAPRAVTLSALIYCLRCMVGHDVPLNQGCLIPVEVKIPKGSIIDPSQDAAVVGGNVQTCQRIVDVIFKAFEACAASQGCMNNVTFGDEDMGYYETIAGGAGAGPTWNGRSGVHVHMTNTRITDPEILERRYPVILKRFELNSNTGGRGKFNGGEGVVRELLFRKDLTLSILTERRAFRPYGLKGGLPGKRGKNTLIKSGGRRISLGGKTSVPVGPWDSFCLESPGGGGYGKPSLADLSEEDLLEISEQNEDDNDAMQNYKRRKLQETGKSAVFAERGSVAEYRRLQESV